MLSSESSAVRACLLPLVVHFTIISFTEQAHSQSTVVEYTTCAQERRTEPDIRIFACSKVIGDSALPPDIRAKALAYRAMGYSQRGMPAFVSGNRNNVDYERAWSDFNAALQLNPSELIALYLRAQLHHFNADFDDAIADLTEIMSRDSKFSMFGMSACKFRALIRAAQAKSANVERCEDDIKPSK